MLNMLNFKLNSISINVIRKDICSHYCKYMMDNTSLIQIIEYSIRNVRSLGYSGNRGSCIHKFLVHRKFEKIPFLNVQFQLVQLDNENKNE